MKQPLLGCSSNEDPHVPHVLTENCRSRYSFIEYLNYLLSWHSSSRPYLDIQSFHNARSKYSTGSNSFFDGTTSAPSPAPSPHASAVKAPHHNFTPSPAPTPASSPEQSRTPDTADYDFSHPDDSDSPPPTGSTNSYTMPQYPPPFPKSPHRSHGNGKTLQSPQYEDNIKTTIAAIVVFTASLTFVLAVLLFYCLHRWRRVNVESADQSKDDKPLLFMSFSDFSIGSSQRSSRLGSSTKGEKSEIFSLGSSTNRIHSLASPGSSTITIDSDATKSSILESRSSSSVSGVFKTEPSNVPGSIHPPLPLPPGMVKTEPSNLHGSIHPPLPLPPGMVRPPATWVAPPPFMSPQAPPPAPPPAPAPRAPLPPASSGIKPAGPQPPPAPPPKAGAGVRPGAPRPPPPLAPSRKPGGPAPPPPGRAGNLRKHSGSAGSSESDAPKTKLKPFFWDKVLASPDHSMVWDEISSGSFQFNEEMIESLFGYNAPEKPKNNRNREQASKEHTYIHLLDHKKSQNISILLKALSVTMEEVCDALLEGNELHTELIQTLLKMAPTAEEELKLRLYNGDLSQLGHAERFLKALVEIPFSFKRMETLLFIGSFKDEVSSIKESFATLEVACTELKSSRLFLKLLEAVLKTGNRMNDGTYRGGAQAFKLDTLLKLSDVKGTDGKTTLLHFVVQEIIRSEGARAARIARESISFSSINSDDMMEEPLTETAEHLRNLGIQVIEGLGSELQNVRKAAVLDADMITNMVANIGQGIVKAKEFLKSDLQGVGEEDKFCCKLRSFVENAEGDAKFLFTEEKRMRALVKCTTDYFHGNMGKDEGFRLFVVVRDFLGMVDKICKEVKLASKKTATKSTSLNKDEASSKSTSKSTSIKDESSSKSTSIKDEASLKSTSIKDETSSKSTSIKVEASSKSTSINKDEASLKSTSINKDVPTIPSVQCQQLLFPAIKDRRVDSSSSDDES
ncbi:hypothetical protein ACLOJK_035868 [Asimina triloba]